MAFGDFAPLCRNVPSYPWCNLFYRQLQRHSPASLTGLSRNATSAPVGVNPVCGIPRLHSAPGNLGNIPNAVLCAVSILIVLVLIRAAALRKAAVARVELIYFLVLYLISLPLQLLTTSSFLAQGSTALVALSAVHAGIIAALFWTLLGNAFISMQVVEDGTLSSLIPFSFFMLAIFGATTYVAFDVALTVTHALGPSVPPQALHSIPLFVLTTIWPGAAALFYIIVMIYVIMGMLREVRPLWFYVLATVLFILSQLVYFLLSKVICNGTSSKIDGSFLATLLETASVVCLVLGWRSITEETWDDSEAYYNR